MENKTGLTIKELAKGLDMDRSNLNKLVKKLNLKTKKIRGKMNQWTHVLGPKEIETILAYRDGIPHNLVKSKGNYKIREEDNE